MATCKKRKYEDENRQFRQEWEEKYAFIERSGKPLYLICIAALSYSKVSDLKRHYDSNHGHFYKDRTVSLITVHICLALS